MLLAWMIQQAADLPASQPSWVTILNQYGVLGLVAGALFLFAREQIRREQDRGDRLEAQLTQMHAATADKVIPALVAATQVIQDTQQIIRDMEHRDRSRQP